MPTKLSAFWCSLPGELSCIVFAHTFGTLLDETGIHAFNITMRLMGPSVSGSQLNSVICLGAVRALRCRLLFCSIRTLQ
jgi:hypothetical protein